MKKRRQFGPEQAGAVGCRGPDVPIHVGMKVARQPPSCGARLPLGVGRGKGVEIETMGKPGEVLQGDGLLDDVGAGEQESARFERGNASRPLDGGQDYSALNPRVHDKAEEA